MGNRFRSANLPTSVRETAHPSFIAKTIRATSGCSTALRAATWNARSAMARRRSTRLSALPQGYRMDWGGEYSQFLEARSQMYFIGPLGVGVDFHDSVCAVRKLQISGDDCAGRDHDRTCRRTGCAEADAYAIQRLFGAGAFGVASVFRWKLPSFWCRTSISCVRKEWTSAPRRGKLRSAACVPS